MQTTFCFVVIVLLFVVDQLGSCSLFTAVNFLSFRALLQSWKNCQLRIFTVAEMSDNSVMIRNKLEALVYKLRIEAEIEVVELVRSYSNCFFVYTTRFNRYFYFKLCVMSATQRERFGVISAKQPLTTLN